MLVATDRLTRTSEFPVRLDSAKPSRALVGFDTGMTGKNQPPPVVVLCGTGSGHAQGPVGQPREGDCPYEPFPASQPTGRDHGVSVPRSACHLAVFHHDFAAHERHHGRALHPPAVERRPLAFGDDVRIAQGLFLVHVHDDEVRVRPHLDAPFPGVDAEYARGLLAADAHHLVEGQDALAHGVEHEAHRRLHARNPEGRFVDVLEAVHLPLAGEGAVVGADGVHHVAPQGFWRIPSRVSAERITGVNLTNGPSFSKCE